MVDAIQKSRYVLSSAISRRIHCAIGGALCKYLKGVSLPAIHLRADISRDISVPNLIIDDVGLSRKTISRSSQYLGVKDSDWDEAC